MNLNESEDNDSDLIFTLINDVTRDAKLYINPKRNSIWMIIPKEKKWIFEVDSTLIFGGINKTVLFYNEGFFKTIFRYLSKSVYNHEKFIKEWVENITNVKVDDIRGLPHQRQNRVDDTLKKRNQIK